LPGPLARLASIPKSDKALATALMHRGWTVDLDCATAAFFGGAASHCPRLIRARGIDVAGTDSDRGVRLGPIRVS
jgi:hypothetical protein